MEISDPTDKNFSVNKPSPDVPFSQLEELRPEGLAFREKLED
jgi:hypothetical protein